MLAQRRETIQEDWKDKKRIFDSDSIFVCRCIGRGCTGTFPGLFLSSSSKLNWKSKGVNTSSLGVLNINLGARVTSGFKKGKKNLFFWIENCVVKPRPIWWMEESEMEGTFMRKQAIGSPSNCVFRWKCIFIWCLSQYGVNLYWYNSAGGNANQHSDV